MAEPDKERGSYLSMTCFAHSNQTFYPNIHSILTALLTFPIGSCSCERSFTALRWLKTWCRNKMTEQRLDAVAMGHIHQERSVYPEDVLQAWGRS